MNSSYLCILLCLSGLQPNSDIREKLGWALVCVSLITVSGNFAKLIYVKARTLARKIINNRTKIYLSQQEEIIKMNDNKQTEKTMIVENLEYSDF
jgi:hypothetical protein